jgi:hypothetical protein
MGLSDLRSKLRLEYDDGGSPPLLSDEQLNRAISRAVFAVNLNLERSYTITQEEIQPDLDADDEEALLTQAMITVCAMLQSKTARNFSFSSGDKKIDKTKQPEYWAKLGQSYEARYKEMVSERNPAYGSETELLTPVIYGND